MGAFFNEDTSAWNKEFNSQAGMIGKKLRKMAKETEAIAKVLAPSSTGLLRRSIQADSLPRPSARGMQIEVTASARHAWMVHEGTRPHTITPDTTQVLVFPTKGGVVFTDQVTHPGTDPDPFLMDALRIVMKAHAENVHQIAGR